jgi:prevent-host-death family protein
MEIRPVSDLRHKFPEIEGAVSAGQPVFLTKNGHGAMVVLSLAVYERLTSGVERALREADRAAARDPERLSHDEVFGRLKGGRG